MGEEKKYLPLSTFRVRLIVVRKEEEGCADNKVKEGGTRKGRERKKGALSALAAFPPPNQEQEKERKIINHCLLLFSLRNLSKGGGGVGFSREKGRKKADRLRSKARLALSELKKVRARTSLSLQKYWERQERGGGGECFGGKI